MEGAIDPPPQLYTNRRKKREERGMEDLSGYQDVEIY